MCDTEIKREMDANQARSPLTTILFHSKIVIDFTHHHSFIRISYFQFQSDKVIKMLIFSQIVFPFDFVRRWSNTDCPNTIPMIESNTIFNILISFECWKSWRTKKVFFFFQTKNLGLLICLIHYIMFFKNIHSINITHVMQSNKVTERYQYHSCHVIQ